MKMCSTDIEYNNILYGANPITIPDLKFNTIDVEFLNSFKLNNDEYLALHFSNNDIDCYVPSIDYFHFSIYENKIGNRYIYKLGIGNDNLYKINKLNVKLCKFKITYSNDNNCRLVFTQMYDNFNVIIRFNTYPVTGMERLLFIKNDVYNYINSTEYIRLQLIYTPDLHLPVKCSSGGNLTGYDNLVLKDLDTNLIKFKYDSESILIAMIKIL